MKNMCPSCGYPLFGDKEIQKIEHVKMKIKSTMFSQSMSEDTIFDISLFILNEFLEEAENIEDEDAPDVVETEEELEESEGESLEKIRDSVRKEVLGDDEVSSVEETEDMRIARLKRMAKESSNSGKTGVMVRRSS
tara:strand:- start:488 stop:895 length:408 start_codon:yes stop_codon:yes gene_type:complete